MSPVRIRSPWKLRCDAAASHQYPTAIESPLTSRCPGVPAGTDRPSSSTTSTRYPATGRPDVPGRRAVGVLEM